MTSITATEAARKLSDLLNRVRYRRESFEVRRGGEPVARIVPVEQPRTVTVAALFAHLSSCDHAGSDFADELESILAEQPKLDDDPWGT